MKGKRSACSCTATGMEGSISGPGALHSRLNGAEAFWIDPEGCVGAVPITHITAVLADPERFGLTASRLREVYARHGEPLGLEGKARREIMDGLLRKGWIRIRRKSWGDWMVEAGQADRETASRIRHLLEEGLAQGAFKSCDRLIFQTILDQGHWNTDEMPQISGQGLLERWDALSASFDSLPANSSSEPVRIS